MHIIFSFLVLKKKRAVCNCKELCYAEIAKLAIPLHAHTCADVVSDFFGQERISVRGKVEKSPQEAVSLLNGE